MGEPSSHSRLTDHATEEVLHLAVVRDLRTIDRLLDALSLPEEGPTLLRRLIADGGLDGPEAVRRFDLDQLSEVKQGGKRRVSVASAESDRMIGSWQYIVAVAAGFASHSRNISSTPPAELRPLLLDLSEVTPAPWAALFAEAAGRCVGGGL